MPEANFLKAYTSHINYINSANRQPGGAPAYSPDSKPHSSFFSNQIYVRKAVMNVPGICGEMREKHTEIKVSNAWLSLKDRRIVAEQVQTVTHEGVAVKRISY